MKITIAILLALLIILKIIQLDVDSQLYVITPAYENLENQITNEQMKNMQLQDRLLELESYTRIASIAASEGFVPVHDLDFNQ